MKINGSYKVFEADISWGEFFPFSKVFQDERTFEKRTKL